MLLTVMAAAAPIAMDAKYTPEYRKAECAQATGREVVVSKCTFQHAKKNIA